MIKKLKRHWFLLGLVSACFFVLADPTGSLESIGRAIKNAHGPSVMIFLIFMVSGLMLDGPKIRAGIGDIKATLTALAVILIGAPAIAFVFSFFILDKSIIIGLFIVAAMPTTLSSGVVMTHAAGGNMAHALFVTIISNIIGIFTIPIILSALLSRIEFEIILDIDKTAIVFKLLFLVLLPLILGLVFRAVTQNRIKFEKYRLSIVNQCLILIIVFVSTASARQTLSASAGTVLFIVGIVGLFHLCLLLTAAGLIRVSGFEKGRYESILFMGSQKTLPLSVMLQVTYFQSYGMALVVCIFHHIVHLLIDGYLSARLGKRSLP